MNPSSVLSYKTHIRSLIALGFPIIIGQIGTIVQGLADTIMTGQYSSQALAAAGFVNNVMTLVLIFAMGYSYGLTPVVGAYHARQEHHHIGQSLRCSLQTNGILAAVIVLLMGSLYFFWTDWGNRRNCFPSSAPTIWSFWFLFLSRFCSTPINNSSTESERPRLPCGS